MAFNGIYLLASIDGTSSKEWRRPDGTNSHCYKFYRDFKVQNSRDKKYFHGPHISGVDLEDIIYQVSGFLKGRIRAYFPNARPSANQLRIVLVGHSRGGFIAMNVAKQMPLPVYFLGLYDAVKRAFTNGNIIAGVVTGGPIIPVMGLLGSSAYDWLSNAERVSNVQFTYHALRDPEVNSRPYFGNTGRKYTGFHEEKLFYTSHGGIGGDPIPSSSGKFGRDLSCSNETVRGGVMRMSGQNLEDICKKNSNAVDTWMRTKAKSKGLPIR